MNEELKEGETKRGKLVKLPDETIAAMQKMRNEGKPVKFVADFFHVSTGTVSKYCPQNVNEEQPGEETKPENTGDVNEKITKTIEKSHNKRMISKAKEWDDGIIKAGDSMEKFLQDHNIFIDINKIPSDQLIRIIKGVGGYQEMDPKLKEMFDKWINEKLSGAQSPITAAGSGKINFDDIKEILYLKFLMKMANEGDGSGNQGNAISEMRAEFRTELERNRQEMRDLVLEKRFQTIDYDREQLGAQIANIEHQISNLKLLATDPDPSVRQGALGDIDKLVTTLDKIKSAYHTLGLGGGGFNSGDKTFDRVLNIGETLAKGWAAQKPPKQGELPGYQTQVQDIQPTRPEDYAATLMAKATRTAEEEQWLANYRNYLAQIYAKVTPQQAPGCRACGSPEIYRDGLCGKCWASVNVPLQQQQQVQYSFEDLEKMRSDLLKKPTWTNEEARFFNEWEKQRTKIIAEHPEAGQQPQQEAQPEAAVEQPSDSLTYVESQNDAVPTEEVQEDPKITRMRAAEVQKAEDLGL